jgi:hypothetical protein
MTEQVADPEQTCLQGRTRDIDFQMSHEQCRCAAMRAIARLGAESVFAFPVERVWTAEPLLLVLHADDEHLADAIDAVLSVDPQAEAVMSHVLFADSMTTTPNNHSSESMKMDPLDGFSNSGLPSSSTARAFLCRAHHASPGSRR